MENKNKIPLVKGGESMIFSSYVVASSILGGAVLLTIAVILNHIQ